MYKRFSYLIRDYFGFSRTESRGLLVLLMITVLAVMGSIFYEKYTINSYQHLSEDKAVLEALLRKLDARVVHPTDQKEEVEKPEVKRFYFDPNTAGVESLINLGIPDYLAQRIEKYRRKGGHFKSPESLKKIYGFPEDLFRDLAPYIRIVEHKSSKPKANLIVEKPENIAKENEQAGKVAVPEVIRLNINKTDSVALQQLQGIGKVISSRIVKFRDKLGGIHSIDQLQEVYHISEQAMASLRASAYVEDSFVPKKININQADFKTLYMHPYISYEMAKGIINHRRIYGKFTSANQLKEVYQINEESLVKLLPYLVIY